VLMHVLILVVDYGREGLVDAKMKTLSVITSYSMCFLILNLRYIFFDMM